MLDSSYLIAAYNQRDVHHLRALQAGSEFRSDRWGKGLLLDYVFAETMNVLHRRAGPAIAIAAGQHLFRADDLELVNGASRLPDAFLAFSRQEEPALSVIDLVVLQCARDLADGNVLTFDRGFKQMPDARVFPG